MPRHALTPVSSTIGPVLAGQTRHMQGSNPVRPQQRQFNCHVLVERRQSPPSAAPEQRGGPRPNWNVSRLRAMGVCSLALTSQKCSGLTTFQVGLMHFLRITHLPSKTHACSSSVRCDSAWRQTCDFANAAPHRPGLTPLIPSDESRPDALRIRVSRVSDCVCSCLVCSAASVGALVLP